MIAIISILFVLIIMNIIKTKKTKLLWYQCNDKYAGEAIFKLALKEQNHVRTYDNNWNIILPCKSKYSIVDYNKIKINNSNQIIPIVTNNGILGNKRELWKALLSYYGRTIASQLMPKSYIIPTDIDLLKQNFKNQFFIMKKEIQRQRGLKLSNIYDELINSTDYSIIQEYQHNSLTYKNYKMNFRIYLVYINNKKAFIFNNGMITYSKNKVNDNIKFNNAISSFSLSKDHYHNNFPLTLKQLQVKLPNVPWNNIINKIKYITNKVLNATNNTLGYNSKDNINFQLFGMDFFIDKNYNVKLIEINIGPGMNPYNEIDKQMRINLYKNILDILTNKKTPNMINVWNA